MTKLQRAEDKFILLFENSPIGMAMVSHDTGEFLEVNDALLSYVGYTRSEFLAMSFWDITPRKYDFQEQTQIEELNQTGRFGPNEKEYIRKDGSLVPIRLSGFKMLDVDGREVVWGVIENISTEKSLEAEREKLRRMSITDHLTGLNNRQKLEEVLLDAVNRLNQSPFCVILLDMDHFKLINDSFGHSAGDYALVEVADILKSHARQTDITGRWGGEEFLIICPDTSIDEARQLAEKVRHAIEQTTFTKAGNTSASFGISQLTEGDSSSSLINRADKAMYQAKRKGRNQVICL